MMKHFFYILIIWEVLACEFNITEDLLKNDIITLQCLLSGSAQCSWKRRDNFLSIDGRYKYLNATNQNDCSIVIYRPSGIDVAMWNCDSMTSDYNQQKIHSTNCSQTAIKNLSTTQSAETVQPTNTPWYTLEPNIRSENVSSSSSNNETSPTKDLKPILYTFIPAFGALGLFVIITIIFTVSKFVLNCTLTKQKKIDPPTINQKLEKPIPSRKLPISSNLDGYFPSNNLVDGSNAELYGDVSPVKPTKFNKKPNLFSLTPTLKFKRSKNKIVDPITSSVVNLTEYTPSSSSLSNNANLSTTTLDSTANELHTSHDYEYIDNINVLLKNPLIGNKSKLNASFDVVSSRPAHHSNLNSRHSCSTTQLPRASTVPKPKLPAPLEPPPIVERPRNQQPLQVSTPRITKRTKLTLPYNNPKDKAPPVIPSQTKESINETNGQRNCTKRPSYIDILEDDDQCNIYADAISCYNDKINISMENKLPVVAYRHGRPPEPNRENKPLIKI